MHTINTGPAGGTVTVHLPPAALQDLSAQLQRLREEQLPVKEGNSTTLRDTTEQEKEVESLRCLLSERSKELEEAVRKGDRTAEELAQAQEGIKVH